MASLRLALIAFLGILLVAVGLLEIRVGNCVVHAEDSSSEQEGSGESLRNELEIDYDQKLAHRHLTGSVFSPDGRILVTGGEDIRLWDPRTRKLIRRFGIRDRERHCILTFSPDGRFLFSDEGITWRKNEKGDFADVCMWDVSTGKMIRKFRGNSNVIWSLAVAPDGKTLVSCSAAGAIRAWDVETGRALSRPYCRPSSNDLNHGTVAFSPDGKFLVIPTSSCLPGLWDLTQGRKVRELHPKEDSGVMPALAFAPDGRSLAAAIRCGRKAICVWDVESGRVIGELAGARQVPMFPLPPKSMDPPPSKEYIKLANSNLRQWENYGVSDLAYSPDGKMLASLGGFPTGGRDDGPELRLWEMATSKELAHWKVKRGWWRGLAFSADGRTLALGIGEPGNNSVLLLEWGRRDSVKAQPTRGTERANLLSLWDALAGKDVPTAFRSVRELIARPGPAVELLAKHAQPIPAVPPARLARWIAELDDAEFGVRERASAALARLLEGATPALRETLAGPSLEARRRARELLERLNAPPSEERVRFLRAVMVLEYIGTIEAQRALKKLAEGMRGARETEDARAAYLRVESRARMRVASP